MTMDEAQVVFDTTQIGIYALAGLFFVIGLLLSIGDIILVIQKHRWKKKNKPLLGKAENSVVGLVTLRTDLEQKAEDTRKLLRDYERMIADIDATIDEIRDEDALFGWERKKEDG